MSGYQESYNSRGGGRGGARGGGRGGYYGKTHDSNYSRTSSYRDDRTVSFNTDARSDGGRAYGPGYSQRDRYHERDPRSDRPPYSDNRDRYGSGNNSPPNTRDERDFRRPELLDMSRTRSRPGSPLATPALTSAGGLSTGEYLAGVYSNSAGVQTPTSARPSSSSGERLVEEIRKMMHTVGNNVMLEKERDAAKRNFEKQSKIYKETQSMNQDFPKAAFLARQDRDEAQATLNRLEHELKQAEANFSPKSIARYLEELVPAAATANAVVSRPSRDEEEQLAANKRSMESMKLQIKGLAAELEAAKSEIKKIDMNSRSTAGSASKQLSRIDEIAQRQMRLMTDTQKIPDIEKKINDLAARSVPSPTADGTEAELIRKRVVALESQMSTTLTKMSGFEGKIAVVQKNSPAPITHGNGPSNPDLSKRVTKLEEVQQAQARLVETINEMVEATQASVQDFKTVQGRVDSDLKQLNENMQTFDEDIVRLSEQVHSMESDALSTPSGTQSRPANPDAMDFDSNPLTQSTTRRNPPRFNEKQENVRSELKVTPAVFAALGEIPAKLYGLLGMKEFLIETQGDALDQLQSEFDAQLQKLRNEISGKLQALETKEQDLESKHKRLQTDHESLYQQAAKLAALPQPSPPAAPREQEKPEAGNAQNGMQLAALSDLSRKIDDIDSKYGIFYRGLDTRMQNTHTDALAAQILGSLQFAYPNLAQVDEVVRVCEENRAMLEKDVKDLKKTTEKIRNVVNAQGVEVKDGKNARLDMQALGVELRGRLEEMERRLESVGGGGGASAGAGGAGLKQARMDELNLAVTRISKIVDDFSRGIIGNGAEVATIDGVGRIQQQLQQQISNLEAAMDGLKHATQDTKHEIALLKLDVNEKLRAFDIQLQEFRAAISFQDGANVNDKIQILTNFAKGIELDLKDLRARPKGEKRTGEKRSSSETTLNDSDVNMRAHGVAGMRRDGAGDGEERAKKKKKNMEEKEKSTGALVADGSDGNPYR